MSHCHRALVLTETAMRDIWENITSVKPGALGIAYTGTAPGLFLRVVIDGTLTVLTLGVYGVWMVHRVRKYMITSIAPGGDGLEYRRSALSGLGGTLAVALGLALYLLAVNAALFQASLLTWPFPNDSLANIRPDLVAAASAIALLPFAGALAYARQRRTIGSIRWRGVAFGMRKGAWSYSVLWLAMTVLTIASAGLLWPLRTFWLARFRADRTTFGKLRLRQRGSWRALYQPFAAILLSVVAAILVLRFVRLSGAAGMVLDGAIVAGMLVAYVHYRVQAFVILTNNKRLGRDVRFRSDAQTADVLAIVISGCVMLALVAAIVLIFVAVAMLAVFAIQAAMAGWRPLSGASLPEAPIAFLSRVLLDGDPPVAALVAAIPLAIFGVAVWMAMIRQEILVHLVTTLDLRRVDEIEDAVDRARPTPDATAQ